MSVSSAKVINGVVCTEVDVRDEWLDYNGHVNVAYYLIAFEHGLEDLKCAYGLDEQYRTREKRSTVALENHLTYQNEAMQGDRLRIESRILETDGKRMHFCQAMYRDSTLLATQEVISLSFDLAARRSSPFAPALLANIQRMLDESGKLPKPSWIGRNISLNSKRPTA
jgi:acyl-CoA thioester hydrolase